MTQRLLLFWVVLWLLPISNLSAQVGFSLPVRNEVDPGSYVTLPVKVSNFDSITGAQFVIRWDSSVLSFVTVAGYGLPNMTPEDFGLGDTLHGIVRFAWESPSSTGGTTVADGTTIFLIKFFVTGEINEGSFLTFSEDPPQTIFEVTQATTKIDSTVFYTINDCNLANGYIAVGFTLSADLPDDQNSLPVTISPNPVTDFTTVNFELDTRSEVQLVLTDAAGHPVFEKKVIFPAGRHGMEIASDQLQKTGIYYLILRTASRSCIRPLVKL